jgi:hypothetical protein
VLWSFPVVAQAFEYSVECPVCKDDWFPMPLKLFHVHDMTMETPIKNDAQKIIVWNMSGNFEDDLNAIQNCNNPINISTTFYKGDKSKLFSKLAEIKCERIVSLDISLSNYSLTVADMNCLLSLTNLENLLIRVKKIPLDLPSKLTCLKKLKYIFYISDRSEESTKTFMSGIALHPTLERLSLCNMRFTSDVSWQLPIKTRCIVLNNCLITLPVIEKIGNTKSIIHAAIPNSKFSETNLEIKTDSLFHSQIRCLEIHDKKLSRYILDNIEKFPKLKMLAIKVEQNDLAFVKSRICDTKNIIRILLFYDEHIIRNKIFDDFIKDIRFNHAIYVDYYYVWFDLYLQLSSDGKESIPVEMLNFRDKNKIIELTPAQ